MIAKITGGGGFRGVLDYLMNEKEQAKEQVQELAKEREKEQAQEREQAAERTAEQAPQRSADAAAEHEQTAARRQIGEGKEITNSFPERELSEREESALGERAARHRIIGGNMSGQTPRELAREFGVFREQRPDIAKPVHHASISAAEGERLPIEQWNEIADKYAERMGFGDCPYVVVQHLDTAHDHIHIVLSRIDLEGKVVSEFQSKMRAEAVMREVEREYGLTPVTPSREVERATLTRGEVERFERTGDLSAKMQLQERVELALKDAPTTTEFVERLNRGGVEVIPNLQRTGRMSGISFRIGEELMKGSDLGRGFSWGGLQQRGLEYVQERDNPVLEAARDRATMSRIGEQIEAERSLIVPAQEIVERVEIVPTIEIGAPSYPLPEPLVIGERDRMAESLTRSAPEQGSIERLDRLTGVEQMSGREAMERLDRLAGIERDPEGRDALEQLNRVAGVEPEREHEPEVARTPERVAGREVNAPEMAQTIEKVAEREVQERVIEIGLELSL